MSRSYVNFMAELAAGALEFAEGDIASAKKVIVGCECSDSSSRIKFRASHATRSLESAQQQISAAIALLREDCK